MPQSHPARVFTLLTLSQTLSLLGSRMSALAVGLWLFTTTGAATPLALTALAAVLPRLLVAGPAGVAADRWDRRAVLLAAELLQATTGAGPRCGGRPAGAAGPAMGKLKAERCAMISAASVFSAFRFLLSTFPGADAKRAGQPRRRAAR